MVTVTERLVCASETVFGSLLGLSWDKMTLTIENYSTKSKYVIL